MPFLVLKMAGRETYLIIIQLRPISLSLSPSNKLFSYVHRAIQLDLVPDVIM